MTTFHRLAAYAALCVALCLPTPHAAAQTPIQAGPGAWSANQVWANDTTHGGALNGYYYWPATPPLLNSGRALVLVLHGCGQTAGGDVINGSGDAGYNWKAVADTYGAVILAPNATGNLYSAHCWDWAATNRSRSYGHTAVLLDLINRFLNNPQYAIDPKQVYVTGLSSGGAKAMVLGCTAPEVFAGLGLSAAPPPGVTTGQISLVPSGYSASTAASACSAMAGSAAGAFATQIAGVILGTSDYTVAQAYGPLDAAAMRQVYGGAWTQAAAVSVPGSGSDVRHLDTNGKVRTSQVTVTGLAHAWPAGSGGQNANYVNATRVNYPAFVMDFWFDHNLRVAQGPGPEPDPGTPPPTFTCTTSTASSYAHVGAGRAYVSSGYARANGSNQVMGLYNVFLTSTLAQTAAGYYVMGSCP
ncbi:PHB depolymerase family esterase [Massilia aurea]|uniref:extracellular catalytic domain type 1 short-chain-length polyhydroxyalkanoate depolymerase n=1 Tax=Massilia aurea TaxID=373040 RepID=UPI00346271F1